MLPAPPPALQAPAPPSPDAAQDALLTAYDEGSPLPAPARLKGAAALRDRWLREAIRFTPGTDLPADPYAAGPARQEAEALRALLKAPAERWPAALKALPLREPGTAMALWRWGRIQVREGRFSRSLRQAWEDRLIQKGPGLTRGYGLRHALCWALADQDEARLAALRGPAMAADETVFTAFQRLFGLLGGPAPELRLWRVSTLAYDDLALDRLGPRKVWISPDGPAQGAPAPGVAWIIPSQRGDLDERAAHLPESLAAEARVLSGQIGDAAAATWFAPSRQAFERVGLLWFPILLDLSETGAVTAIRMGDAAPRQP